MSQPSPCRRSQRSNRRLPARYLDESIEVGQTSPHTQQSSSPRGKAEGKHEASPPKSKTPCSSHHVGNKSACNISKYVRKVKCKTDIGKRSFEEEKEDGAKSGEAITKPTNTLPPKSKIGKQPVRKVPKRGQRVKNKTDVSQNTLENEAEDVPGTISKESLHCDSCGRAYSRLSSLRRHVQAGSCKRRSAEESDLEEEEGSSEQTRDCSSKKARKVCKICRKSFADKHTLLVHRRSHTGERPYHCTLCDKWFTQRSTLQFHLDTHSGKKHECSICGYKFTQARTLKRHMLFHTGNKTLKRKMRNYDYKKVRVLAENTDECEGEGDEKGRTFVEMYECEYCEKRFRKVAELTVHIRVHTNERPYKCKYCDRSFKQLCHLNGHQATHEKARAHICENCGSLFTQVKSLRRHLMLNICNGDTMGETVYRKRGRPRKDERVQTVVVGNKQFDNGDLQTEVDKADDSTACQALENLRQGVEDSVDENIVSPSVDAAETRGGFICEQCGKTFLGRNNFMQHIRTHSSERAFSCNVCQKKFRLLTYLREHLKTHSQEKPFSCENCNKRFKNQRSLQNHTGRNSCTGNRPFTCDTCGKAFMYSRYLKTHRCNNTPVRMYSCGECGKLYERRDRLIEHMRVHTGERPYICTTCGKTFAKIANFRLHQRVHTGEKKFECTQCGKRFAHSSTLKYHEGTHSANKPFPCDQCDKQFPRSKALLTHQQAVHGVGGGGGRTSYLCANCGKVYHHLKRLLRHFCEANGGKRFRCGVCDKQFDREKQLEIHMRVHTGEKPFECDKCGKCFSQSGGLKDHMLSHTREKKFQCDLCEVKFLRMKSLRKHKLIIHTGVEPQICRHCGATFKYYKALKKHELIHGSSDQKTFTDILEDIEQAMNNASTEVVHPEQAILQVVNAIDHSNQVAEVVIQENQEIIIGVPETGGQVLHLLQDPQQLEIDQSIQEIQIQAQLEEEERAQQVLMAVVASVDHHEEVVSAP